MRAPILALALCLAVPSSGLAASAISCHCFRDRAFDPTRPAAADPYVLATARNSLLAAAFGIDKGDVVRALMTGTSPDDLWVAHWAAAKIGADAGRLLELKSARGTWASTLTAAVTARLGPSFSKSLASGAPDAALAAEAVDDILVRRLRADPRALQALRARGASTQEVILCTLLAPRSRSTPGELFADQRSRHRSWGAVVNGLGLAPTGIEGEIRRVLTR
ncbi:MAG: hypothetical protein HZB55_15695 [Deltaproteobacteria bacterium]|nr:hypothetical protein [Deltaproteobacteria bacterium]